MGNRPAQNRHVVSSTQPEPVAVRTEKMDARPSPIRVLLVDDHQLLTDALSSLLSREPDMIIVGTCGSVSAVRTSASDPARKPTDVVLMDYVLPDGTGAEATREIKRGWPAAKVVILTGLTDDETMLGAVEAGADGYITKERAGADVVDAVRAAHAGEILLPRAVAYQLAQRLAAASRASDAHIDVRDLTPRELEVLRALVLGRSSREICAELYISPNTLRTHVQNLLNKLRVHSKLEAVAFALRQQLVEMPSRELYS
jgi:DNA-binding NarL/FixJ family response regulator